MSFNTLGQYTANHKVWDHVGNIIPDIEHSEGVRPAYEFKPAAWLPVQFWDKHYENWIVIMPGKVVALDPDGRVMPAQYGLTSASIEYTSDDVAAGTIDIRTGSAVTAASGSFALSTVDGTTYSFMGRDGISFNDTVNKFPIGVAPYAYLQWAGDGTADDDGFNPAALRYHNYNMQHQVAVLCDYVIKLPLIPGRVSSETMVAAWSAADFTYGTANGWRTAATLASATCVRYCATTGAVPIQSTWPVAAYALGDYPVAKHTARTLMTSSVTTLLVNLKDSPSGIVAAGDFWVDLEVGVLFAYSAGGSSLPTVSGSTIRYYHYGTAPGTYISKFASVVATTTALAPGDFLICDSNSNLVRANPATDTFVNVYNVVGQVIAIDSNYPRDGLDRVRTAYSSLNTNATGAMKNATLATSSVGLGQLDQMPGSATGGYPDLIHYAGAADSIVLINLISR